MVNLVRQDEVLLYLCNLDSYMDPAKKQQFINDLKDLKARRLVADQHVERDTWGK
ncbi:MAG: hypothetical protein ACYCPS_00905 [Candidatus Saccharimonadales bacterium]